MLSTQTFAPRAYLRSIGFVLDKEPHQIDRLLLKSLSPDDRDLLNTIWAARNMGLSTGLDMYLVPKTLKQASLLFSYDWRRAAATMEWFEHVVRSLQPASVVEMGCGAGFLLGFLRQKYAGLQLQGVDTARNLVEIGSQLSGSALIAGDYCSVDPDHPYDLILCDFGFDMARFKASTKPHNFVTCGEAQYCANCSDALKPQFDAYLQAWRRWGHAGAHLAVAGRLSNFGILRSFVLAARDVGWAPDLEASKVLAVKQEGRPERFPALVFRPADRTVAPELEVLARFFREQGD
jgi:SAM-dependent methyltransferase